MTQNLLPNQRRLLSIDGNKVTVLQSSLEVQCAEMEGATMGGLAPSIQQSTIAAELYRAEKRRIIGFLKMKERMRREAIPIIREEIEMEIVRKFGTTNTNLFISNLYQEMIQNPRIQCTTRRGQTIKTTLSEQKKYASERNATAMERKKI